MTNGISGTDLPTPDDLRTRVAKRMCMVNGVLPETVVSIQPAQHVPTPMGDGVVYQAQHYFPAWQYWLRYADEAIDEIRRSAELVTARAESARDALPDA